MAISPNGEIAHCHSVFFNVIKMFPCFFSLIIQYPFYRKPLKNPTPDKKLSFNKFIIIQINISPQRQRDFRRRGKIGYDLWIRKNMIGFQEIQ